jgi:hypothetical protein
MNNCEQKEVQESCDHEKVESNRSLDELHTEALKNNGLFGASI